MNKLLKKFKTIGISVFFAFLAVVLVACKGEAETESSADDSGDSEEVTLRFSLWDQFDQEIIDKFEEENPGINIELVTIPDSDYSQKINTMLVGGTAPDVMLSFEADIERFTKNGYIEDMTDYASETDAFEMDDFIPAVAELTEGLGGVYGLPWTYAMEILYYNKDMFDEAGVDYPTADWTMDDFDKAAKELTIKDGNTTTQWGADALTFRGLWWATIGAYGDDIYSDGEIRLGEGLEKTLDHQDKLTNIDQVSPEPSTGGEMADLFTSGKAAMSRNGSWMIANYRDNDFNWDIAPLPTADRDYTILHTGFYTINAESKHKEEAWKFIEFMMGHEGQTMISEFYNNVSALESVAAEGAYKNEGVNGPTNWETFDIAAESGSFGYTLINAGITNDLVSQFEAVILGELDKEEVLENSVQDAQEQLDKLQ